ncbi:leucine-rich repeat-containing protein 66 [Silurus asotus]|uniref:Leucine-rich repeat-containing protein 66 n=1 Tax=Silurus asotus TaxID=30991 RepID=A0AAD5APK9_SILAS|nr:leucine-rich repeat-containing protein 66 [Silurus asotus]
MLVSCIVHCIAVLIFQLCGVQTLSHITSCPASCICEKSSVVNCASLGLSKAPSHIPATATALDLSHNALHSLAPLDSGHLHLHRLQHLQLGNNSLKSLSMCSESRGVVSTRTLTRRNQRCVSWAPDLQLLSADRNQLKCLPGGLGNIKSLKVLQLSHNRISEIGPADLAGCIHLSELQLHHNLITTIHPKTFKDLQNLKILDLSYNLLATIPVPDFLSLRNLNILADISGNRWRCDCNLKTVRRWLSFDRELGNTTWEVVCFSPSHHAGKNLLYLQESDLTCPQAVYNTPGVKEEVTVDEGTEVILSCSTANQDLMHTRWWTPHGQISDSQQFLHISNTTEHDAGLYVCVSGYQKEHVSIFFVHVRKRTFDKRLRREAQIGSVERDDYIQRNVPTVRAVQQPQFVLAICLSVFITFIVAFVLGVILRPFLEKWYKQSLNKRNSSTSPSNLQTSSTRQGPYVNEGYSDTDDQEHEVHEGPRVTFGTVTEIQEQGAVPYYVNVEESQSGSNTSVAGVYDNFEKRESLAENIVVHKEVSLREENNEGFTESSNGMQFEYIPDPEDTTEFEERSISPATSFETHEAQMSYEARESTEQSVDSPTMTMNEEKVGQASTDHQAIIPGFITDPFPLNVFKSQKECVDELDSDLWNDSGDSFSFTEGSPRSSSRVSHVAELQREMSVDELSERLSSCNSCESGESEGGPTEYTVNPMDDKWISVSENDINCVEKLYPFEKDVQTKDQNANPGARFRQDTVTLDPTDIYMTYPRGDSFDDEPFAEYKEYFNSSNISSYHEDEPALYNVHPVYRTSQKTTSLLGEDRSRTSSYSDDEENKHGDYPRRLEIGLEHKVPNTDATPVVNSDRILSIHYDNSSSSTDIEDKCIKEKDRELFKAAQSEPKTATTNSKGTGGFLGFSFKKQPTMPSDNVNPTTNEDNFFATIGQAFDRLPKLKNSLLFSISVPKSTNQQESTSITDRISESQRPNVSLSSKDSIFTKIDPTLHPIPQVKRYLHFSQSRSFEQASGDEIIVNDGVKTESITKDVVRLESVSKPETHFDQISICFVGQCISLQAIQKVQRYIQFRQIEPQTVHELTPNFKEDSFFEQIPISFDEVPKVNQYIQFSSSESQHTNLSTPSASTDQIVKLESVPKTESLSNKINISFDGQSISLQAIPKLQRYVEFRHIEPQTVQELTPSFREDSFLGQIPISFDEVPKVKQYMQFSPSKSNRSNLSTPSASINQAVRPDLVQKAKSPSNTFSICFKGQSISLQAIPKLQRYVEFRQIEPQTVHELTPTFKEASFLGQIPISFDEVPKVKQYIQFSPSKSNRSNLSTPSASINQAVRPDLVQKAKSPSNTFGICFKGQSISLQAIPKLQRYVEFRQIEPQTVHELTPTFKEASFLGQIPIYFDEVPKVKQCIQFSPPESHKPNISTPSASINQVSRLESVPKTESPSNTIKMFFAGQSISLQAIPKVQRYIQFRQIEPQTVQELTPSFREDSFLGQIPISFDEVPKVKQYIQFSPSKSNRSNLSTPSASINQAVRPDLGQKAKSLSNTFGICFKGHSISLQAIPKLQRYVEFRQIEPQTVHELTPTFKEASFLGQIPISFDEVPKVKQYMQFSPPESHKPNISTPSASINQVSRLESVPKTESPSNTIKMFFAGQSISLQAIPKVQRYIQFRQIEPQTVQGLTPSFREDCFLGQIPISFDEVPKVKQYMQFSPSESNRSNLSTPSASVNQAVRPDLVQKAKSPLNTFSICFKEQSISLQAIPKLQRYVEFRQIEPQTVQELTPTFREDSFLGQIPISFDEVPKVKQYIQFLPSESHKSDLTTSSASINQTAKPEVVAKTESLSNTFSIFFNGQNISLHTIPKVERYVQFRQVETQTVQELTPSIKSGGFFEQIPISFNKVPKVKKHLLFSQSETHYQTLSPDHSLKKKYSLSDKQTTPSLVTKVHAQPQNTGDTFFEEIAVSLYGLPKVKKYIQFAKSEMFSEPHSLLNEMKTTMQTGTEVKRNNSPSKVSNPVVDEHNFFEQIGVYLNEIPKVRRRIHFTENLPQPLSFLQQPVTPEVTAKETSHSISATKSRQDKPNFFEGSHVSLGSIPKVKKSLQFTQSEFELSNQSTPSFFGQIDVSLDEVPKVKRYLQVIKSEPQPSTRLSSTSVITENMTPELVSTMKSQSPYIKGDSFVWQIGALLEGIPKVKRHIQFTPAEPHSQFPLLHSSTNRTAKPIHAASELESTDHKQPAAGGHNFFVPIGASFEIPKVKRYIQFSQHSTDSSSLPLHRQTVTPVLIKSELQLSSSSPADKSNNKDPFFKNMDASTSGLPKVKRYIQFTHHQSMSSNNHEVTADVAKNTELLGSAFPIVDLKTPPTEDNFFGQLGTNLNSLPRLNKYIQLTQSKPYPSSQSPSTSDITERLKPEFSIKTQSTKTEATLSPTIEKDDFFGQIGFSFDELPKVKRCIKFTQSEPCFSNQTEMTKQQTTISSSIYKPSTKSSRAAKHLYGSLDLSFNQLPKGKRESEPSLPSDDEFKVTTMENESFGQIDGIPTVNRYTPFKQYNPHHLPPSISFKKWEPMEVGTESRLFMPNVTPATVGDHVPRQVSTRRSNLNETKRNQALSQIQDTPSAVKVSSETARLKPLTKSKSSPYSSDLDGQQAQVDVFKQTDSNSSSGDKIYTNTQGPSIGTPVSQTDPENKLETMLSSLSALSNESAPLQTRKRLVSDPALQDVSQALPDTPVASPGKDDVREYLRDSSLARQRQERRRLLFQQKKRAMNGFSLSSESFTSQESDQ